MAVLSTECRAAAYGDSAAAWRLCAGRDVSTSGMSSTARALEWYWVDGTGAEAAACACASSTRSLVRCGSSPAMPASALPADTCHTHSGSAAMEPDWARSGWSSSGKYDNSRLGVPASPLLEASAAPATVRAASLKKPRRRL